MNVITASERRGRSGRGLRAALFAGAALLCVSSASLADSKQPLWCDPGCGQIVADWGLLAYAAIRADNGYANPMAATRVYAMMHLAMHDAANLASPRYATQTRLSGQNGGKADPAVAAIVAAHDVLRGLYPKQEKALAAALDKALLDAGKGPRIEAGKALGAAVAAAILAERKTDGADAGEKYAERHEPGHYRFVPGTNFIAAPHWRSVRPFALRTPNQFRTVPPPALESAAYTKAYNEVKANGGTVSSTRTADQTAYAHYWYEFSDIGWNRVTRIVARQSRLDLWDSARLFALVNFAMADGYIAGWDSKMAHDFWRPVTAIRRAAEDRNPATEPDANWATLLPTPPIQDHPSTHATLGAAAAAVLIGVLRTDAYTFTMHSPSGLPGAAERTFTSFTAAAEENADSRVMAGLHFRFATDAGMDLGRKIGAVVMQKLQPID